MADAIGEFVLGYLRGLSLAVIFVMLVLLILAVLKFIGKIVRSVIRKFRSAPQLAPPPSAYRFIYDFDLCGDLSELKETIRAINENGYNIVSVTQSGDTYMVFFRRFASG